MPGLPDMVFAANGATVVDGRVLVARFRHAERAAEAPAYREWFTGPGGYREVHTAEHVNEARGRLHGRRATHPGGHRLPHRPPRPRRAAGGLRASRWSA